MPTPDAFDFRTLLACETLLAVVFAVVFYGIHRVFPEVRGVRAVALGFLLVLPDTFLVLFHGSLPTSVSILMANTILLGSLIAMYEGVAAFSVSRSHRWTLWFIAFAAFAADYFYSEVYRGIVRCLIAVTLAAAAIRAVTAVTLLRRSFRSGQRRVVRTFGFFLALVASLGIGRAWTLYHDHVPVAQQDDLQSSMLVSEIFFFALSGLCFLILISRELVARRRIEAQRDPVSGTANRRTLQANLALELERFHTDGQPLSIALAVLDHLRVINDEESHQAGNAAIREVAETMATQLRGSDYIGRYAGDEFLLLFPRTGHEQALIGADRIAEQVARLKFGRPLTLSMGLTEAMRGDSAVTLLARARQALEQAQADGQNCRRVQLPDPTAIQPTAISAVA